jgi:hypothetical protein
VDGSLCGSRLTLAIVGDRTRYRCVERGRSVGRRRVGFHDLSVAVLEDSLSEPGASHGGLDPYDTPARVSMSA